jgi:CheY-like chemotaxis protein
MKHILVVDDNVHLAHIIAASLREYELTVAYNGPEAVARASMLPACDLVITDYMMPGLAGDQLARRIRELHPRAKTMLMTGFGEFVTIDTQAVDVQLGKPFMPSVLRARVQELIGRP